jgi:hypothetical protein
VAFPRPKKSHENQQKPTFPRPLSSLDSRDTVIDQKANQTKQTVESKTN